MITLTFDNLGEATALQRGTFDGSAPPGADPSVTVALPRLLDELGRLGLRATFDVEAINCELNPQAVRAIAGAGHELAVHGWRHEPWAQLDSDHEHELLRRSRAAFGSLGLDPVGFRPPGGELAPGDPGVLAEHGFAWCSAAAGEMPGGGAVTAVPFAWELVDAYWLMASFAARREARGHGAAPRAPGDALEQLTARLADDDSATLVLHPFLMLDDAWWQQTRALLALVSRAGCQTAGDVAARAA